MNDDTVRAIIIGVVLGTIGLICCIMLMVMLAKRKKPRQDNRLPAFHPAPAKTEVIQSKSNKIWLTSPASPPASSSLTPANPSMAPVDGLRAATAPRTAPSVRPAAAPAAATVAVARPTTAAGGQGAAVRPAATARAAATATSEARPAMAANKVVTASKGGPQPLPQPVATAHKDGSQPVATAPTKGGPQPVVAAAKRGPQPAATAAKGEVSQVI